jgi:hypothetical protein
MKRISDYLLDTGWFVPLVQGCLCVTGFLFRPTVFPNWATAGVIVALAAGLAGCESEHTLARNRALVSEQVAFCRDNGGEPVITVYSSGRMHVTHCVPKGGTARVIAP